jgi:hypothetical protein
VKVTALTVPMAREIAAQLCPTHRADVLRENDDVLSWADGLVGRPGLAWAVGPDRPQFMGGVTSDGDVGVLWLAGVHGWTRYVKHAMRICREILKSGLHARYICEVHEFDHVARRFAERLGFSALETRDGLVLYGVTP